MSLFNWMKKAVKVVDKMATEAAEKPDIEKPRKTSIGRYCRILARKYLEIFGI